MKKILPEAVTRNAFELIRKDWMLITARGKDGRVNAMTASWGGVGVLWGKPVAFFFVRPQRFTKRLIDESERVSLCFFDESYRKILQYMGRATGAKEDKIAHCGLDVADESGAPYFTQARMSLICTKLYRDSIKPECFVDGGIADKWYPEKDFHDYYVASIDSVLVAEE